MPATRGSRAAVVLGVAAALFALCTAITWAGLLDGVDHGAATDIQRSAGHARDVVMSWVVLPGSVQAAAGWAAILAVAGALWPSWRGRVLMLVAVVVAGVVLEVALKDLIDHPGPHPGRSVFGLGAAEIGRGSFPSGHAFRGTALAFGTALLARPALRPAATVVAAAYSALLAWALLYLNWHWTSDVVGGVLLGLIASAIVACVPILDRRTSL